MRDSLRPRLRCLLGVVASALCMQRTYRRRRTSAATATRPSSRGYINRGDQEELLRGAAAEGLLAEHQANFIAGSDTVEEQQNADAQNADAVVLGAAGAAAQLAHAARAALRGTLRG